jgi:hypothetical protein
MRKMRRWFDGKRRVVWSEPKLPPYVKFNPDAADPDPDEGIQPGDISMRAVTEEFLSATDDVTVEAEAGEAPRTL